MTTTGSIPVAPIRVVMIGGGYATLHAYRSLVRRVGSAGILTITVVSADVHHNFHGFTGEVVAGLLPLAVTRTPLTEVMPRARVVHGRVVRVDLAQRAVIVQDVSDGAEHRYGYDQLIVGAGAREPVERIPGMAEYGFTLRAPGEFPRFLGRLASVADGESADRPAPGTPSIAQPPAVVIVGGGLAGVELAAAAADRLRASKVRHPVVLVHSGSAVLPGLRAEQPTVAARADLELARLGVRVHTGVSVVAVQQNSVELSDGSSLPAAAVLGTIGQRPDSLPGLESLPHDEGGRLITDPTLLVVPGVWAAGDAARICHPQTGQPVAANALWAIKAGGHLGRNISRVAGRMAPKPFRYRGLGMAMAFGVGRSAAELYGIPILGLPGWLLRLGFFLRFMPQRRRAMSVVTGLLLLPLRGRVPASASQVPSAERGLGPDGVIRRSLLGAGSG
jgi:NADH dehydrogenase